jgi:mono/diheme cytochrome c family protein
MKRDFKAWRLYLIFGLPVLLIIFIAALYFANCGFHNNCSRASLPPLVHTPIPTLIPATLPVSGTGGKAAAGPAKCTVTAETLLSTWVSTGHPETTTFDFTDAHGATCKATFADVQPLFTEANLWYSGALACTACHNSNISIAAGQLDLSSYAGILAGSRRTLGAAKGNDILGGGIWEQSILNQTLFVLKTMPLGRPAGAVPEEGSVILAGTPVAVISGTVTPTATPDETGAEEVAHPSNPGEPGEAVNLKGDPTSGAGIYQTQCASCHGEEGKGGMQNPGSADGSVPPLNPIDPTLKNSDDKTFATNIDLFIQHGSKPEGTNPSLSMPALGDSGALMQQQIADVIAYIISLNK